MKTQRTASPPTTPPTIAPTWVSFLVDVSLVLVDRRTPPGSVGEELEVVWEDDESAEFDVAVNSVWVCGANVTDWPEYVNLTLTEKLLGPHPMLL